MESSSGASLCLEPLTAACKWQAEAGCLLKPHCIDKSGSRGCSLEASYSFSLGPSETEFPRGHDGARAARSPGPSSATCGAMKRPGSGPCQTCGWRFCYSFCTGGCSPVWWLIFWWLSRSESQRKASYEGDFCLSLL